MSQGPHIAPQRATNIPDNVKINNENGKNNEQNNSELLEDKKSYHSIIQYPALNTENLNNMIIHIDDLAIKYDKTINILKDTLNKINTNNTELANRYDTTLKSINDTLSNINTNNTALANRYDTTLKGLDDTLKKSNQIQDNLLVILQKLVPSLNSENLQKDNNN